MELEGMGKNKMKKFGATLLRCYRHFRATHLGDVSELDESEAEQLNQLKTVVREVHKLPKPDMAAVDLIRLTPQEEEKNDSNNKNNKNKRKQDDVWNDTFHVPLQNSLDLLTPPQRPSHNVIHSAEKEGDGDDNVPSQTSVEAISPYERVPSAKVTTRITTTKTKSVIASETSTTVCTNTINSANHKTLLLDSDTSP
uniref:Uncharacterized protein n=1 Tax=Lygus hesperus TaxID=30085 RepID=A0A0A9YX33_LYGHE